MLFCTLLSRPPLPPLIKFCPYQTSTVLQNKLYIRASWFSILFHPVMSFNLNSFLIQQTAQQATNRSDIHDSNFWALPLSRCLHDASDVIFLSCVCYACNFIVCMRAFASFYNCALLAHIDSVSVFLKKLSNTKFERINCYRLIHGVVISILVWPPRCA